MSGICGLIRWDDAPIEIEHLHAMGAAVPERGRYESSWVVRGRVGLLQQSRHLPVAQDPSRQGVASRTELLLVADARIDNRPELIAVLGAESPTDLASASDAELILQAYEHWGTACPEHLVGDFAFALWDLRRQHLFCARDPIGARPFCYSAQSGFFAFASELRQVASLTEVPEVLDGFALTDFLSFNARFEARTMLAAVQKLLPGHCITVKEGVGQGWRYWNPEQLPAIRYSRDEDYYQRFRELLLRCVADQMRSRTGCVGVMVSGGVDSSAVAALAQHLHKSGRVAAQTAAYTQVFDRLKECDESAYAAVLEQETGVELRRIPVDEVPVLPQDGAEMPSRDSPAYPFEVTTTLVLEQARQRGCDVLMNGFGGDSLFDGAKLHYGDLARQGRWRQLKPWFLAGRQQGRSWLSLVKSLILVPWVPGRLLYQLDAWMSGGRYWHAPVWVHSERRRARHESRSRRRSLPRRFRSPARQAQYEDIMGLASQGPIIESLNAQAMRHGIEMRFPLMDRRLAEFVLAAPIELGARPGAGCSKWLLRQAVRGILPETVRSRPDKASWNAYITHRLQAELLPLFRRLFVGSRLGQHQLIDERVLLAEVESFCLGQSRYQSGNVFLYPLFAELWLRRYCAADSSLAYQCLASWQQAAGPERV